ncbi:MAG: recombinase RecA [Caldilineaceae bacterium]|nr:recombinase RecA [Caldilineaceae bacterium]MDE0340409.1 recombinase RecA [Caldilineaceae bacterium]
MTKKRSTNSGPAKALEVAIANLNRRYGDGTIMRLGEATRLDVASIPTGSLSLDIALGVGGIPRGRIIEVYGPESSGKTTLCLHAIAESQRMGGVCGFVDVEHALDSSYARKIGVDVEGLYVSQPDTGEQALEIAEALVRSGAMDVVVVDSVAALVPRAEIEGEMGDSHVGLQARLMSQALRKLVGAVKTTDTSMIFTNQLRQRIGIMFGNPETTSGGMALKFYASVRLDVRRIQSIKQGSDVIGNRTRVTVRKNKVAAPFKVAEFDIMYNEGVSTQGDLLDLGVEFDIIEKRGAFYRFGDIRLGQGRESAKAFLSDKIDIAAQIDSMIRKQAGLPTNLAPQEEAGDEASQDSKTGDNSQEKLFAEAA